MLSLDQKNSIYVAVKKNYTIASKLFTASCIYNNQIMNSYPCILLNYLDEEQLSQNAIGNYIKTDGYGQRSIAMLSINIYAKNAQGLNANQIAGEIARQLSIDIRQNWKSLASDSIWFRRKSSTRNLTNVELAAGITDTSRFQFDCSLAYTISF